MCSWKGAEGRIGLVRLAADAAAVLEVEVEPL